MTIHIINDDYQKIVYNKDIYGDLFGDGNIPFLEVPFNVDAHFELHFLRFNEIQQYIFERGPENCNEEIKAFLINLIEAKTNDLSTHEKNRIDFLIFHFGSCTIEVYNITGHFHYSYDVLQLSIHHKTNVNGEKYYFKGNNIFKYINSFDSLIDKFALNTTFHWLGQFYYYSRSFSGLNDWGNFILDDTLMLVDEQNEENNEFSFLISNLFSWCEFNDAVSEIEYLLKKYEKLEKGISEKSNILYIETIRVSIVISERFHEKYRKEIAQKLKCHVWINEIAKVQFYTISYISRLLPEITFSKIEEVVSSLHENLKCADIKKELHEKSRIAKALNSIIKYCFDEQKYDELNKIILNYYGRNGFKEQVLYIVPNSPQGTKILSNETLTCISHNPFESIVNLTRYRNLALNQFVLLKGVSYTNEMPTGALGTPNYSYGEIFEESLNAIFDLTKCCWSDFKNCGSLMQFDFNGLPTQAIILKQVKSTLPKQISFLEKVNFNKITKILFWTGNSFTSIQEYECVKAICENCGISLTEIKSSKEEFFAEVQNEYDIVWISSHGEHAHYDPFKSKIVLGDDFHIELNEFEHLLNPNLKNRRLFFTNVCEGGISAQTGDMINIGFPALLANSNQDYLSHLWMVQSQIAKIYGVLFMINISKGLMPFNAYEKSTLTLIEGRISVLEELSHYKDLDEISELMESNTNLESLDFSNILNWGSSAYYV